MPTREIQRIRYPHRARRLEVRAVMRPRPRYIRVTLGGDDLADFDSTGPTDHVKLIPPDPATSEPVLPVDVDGRLVFDGQRPPMRDLTIRRWDAEARQLDVRVLDHGDGPLSRWASSVRVGDAVGIMGPKSSKIQPDGFTNYLLIGDRTAIPAIARWLDLLPQDATGQILIAAQDEDDVIELRSREAIYVRWFTEGDVGVDADQLPPAVASLELYSPDTWAWAAGEALAMREVRRLLLEKPGLSSETVKVTGYWRRGVSGHDQKTSLDD